MIRMQNIYGCYWNKGTTKSVNQDSIAVQSVLTRKGKVLLAVVCDGMGGMAEGEVASSYVVREIVKWFYGDCMEVLRKHGKTLGYQGKLRKSGFRLFYKMNQTLCEYGKSSKKPLGTTASILIAWGCRYTIFHIGDSRIFKCDKHVIQLTQDHAFNEKTLTRCVGVEGSGKPDFITGKCRKNAAFLLCSDGFRHFYTEQDFERVLEPINQIPEFDPEEKRIRLESRLRELGERAMKRGENDNMSAIYIHI